MKNKLVSISLLSAFFLFAGLSEASAQSKGSSYQNAIGLGIDFGDGLTLAGFSGKHFFADNHAGKGEILLCRQGRDLIWR